MNTVTYPDVLEAAQRLPPDDQAQLAEALLRNLRSVLRGEYPRVEERGLIPLAGLSEEELQTLAEAVVAPAYQRQIQSLLAKNRAGTLSSKERATLDRLLATTDQVALLKARALYTLKLRTNTAESRE